MARYDSAIALARKLLVKSGELVSLAIPTAGVENSAQPWRPGTPGAATVSAYAVFIPYTDQGRSPKTYADGTLARTGDLQVFMEAAGLATQPDLNAILTRADGSKWRVRDIRLLDPNGQKVLNELWVTK